ANTADVPNIVTQMRPYRPWLADLLRAPTAAGETPQERRQQLHTSLALLPVDAGQVEYLFGRLLGAEPQEVPVIRDALADHREELLENLWAVMERPVAGAESYRLRAASALAAFDPDSERWQGVQQQVADDLVAVPSVYLATWLHLLQPVRAKLCPAVAAIYRNPQRRETERSL